MNLFKVTKEKTTKYGKIIVLSLNKISLSQNGYFVKKF